VAAGEESRAGDRRRFALRSLATSLSVAVLLVVAFFVLPMDSATRAGGLLTLVGGLAVVVAVLVWHIRQILVAPYPAVRAVSALVVTVPLFLVVFSSIYYLMGVADAAVWSEPLTRLDALYFAVTVFATVGFGDITGTSQTARAVVTVQMVAGLTLVGVIARVVVGAVQVNLRRSGDR
jgi:voltage-gated potassium channel